MECVDIRASGMVMLVVVVADPKGIDSTEEYRLMKEVLRAGGRGCGLLTLLSMMRDPENWKEETTMDDPSVDRKEETTHQKER